MEYFPDSLKTCTSLLIHKKCNVNISDTADYRGSVLSYVYCKLFDNVILTHYSDKLTSSELQLGFKAEHSTSQCMMIRRETLAYYARNQRYIFCTILDASKAFDKSPIYKLFRLLIK